MKRKILSFCTFVLATVFAFGLTACDYLDDLLNGGAGASSVKETIVASVDPTVTIKVDEAEEGTTLMEVMEYLQSKDELSFSVSQGMITEINGKANPADYSYCWMLYTSDKEQSNTEWGVYEYQGQTLGSATLGADSLTVIDGGVYVWVYQSF